MRLHVSESDCVYVYVCLGVVKTNPYYCHRL